MITPPDGLKLVLLVNFLEPDTVLVKDSIEAPEFKIFKSELWPYPNTSLDEDPNWHFQVSTAIPPQLAGTDPLAACQHTAAIAEMDEDYTLVCMQGEKVYYIPDIQARMAGHIYSSLGYDEFKISRFCEFHFDELATEFQLEEPTIAQLADELPDPDPWSE